MEHTAILLLQIIYIWWMQQRNSSHRYALWLIIDIRLRLEIIATLNPFWWRIIPAITKPRYWKEESEIRIAWLPLELAINWYMCRPPVPAMPVLDKADLDKIAE